MPIRSALVVALAAALWSAPGPAPAHEAVRDNLGCHYADRPAGYHCHAGALAGQRFPTKWDALRRLEDRPDAPGWSWPDFAARLWRLLDGDAAARAPNK